MKTSLRRNVRKGGKSNSGSKRAGLNAGVDRYLCSAVYLAPRFAGYVLDHLIKPSLRAASPACGVDLVALARHANAARERTRALRRYTAAALVVALLVLLVALADQSATLMGLAIVVGVAGVFTAVLVDRLTLYHSLAAMVPLQASMRDLAPPLSPEAEKRLDTLISSNVVVFDGGDPFVAWGRLLRPGWQLNLDATKPATDSSGNKRTVVPFSPEDLHRELTRAVRNAGVPDVDVHNRLFVSGASTGAVPGLLPDPLDRPAASVPPNSVRLGITRPRPDARTYLCVEKTSWGGELGVNLNLRAAMVSNDLFIECHAYVLLPLREELTVIDHMPTGGVELTLRAVRDALGAFRVVNRMRGDLRREWATARRRRRALADDRRAIHKNRPFNRGAGVSIRAAAASPDRTYLFAWTDEEMHLNALQRRILTAIADFLDQHGVDATEFHKEQTNIINNHSYAIGSINSQNTMVGSNSTQNNQNVQAPWSDTP